MSAIDASAPELKQAQQLRQQYEKAQSKYDREQTQAHAAELRRQAAAQAKVLELARQKYPAEVEKSMLDEGYDMTVRALGTHKEVLQIEWAMMGRVFVHKFGNSDTAISVPRSLGFKKIILVNSITGEGWSYRLAESP